MYMLHFSQLHGDFIIIIISLITITVTTLGISGHSYHWRVNIRVIGAYVYLFDVLVASRILIG
jgi:hypothetical protein